jgi:hypothetical protein
MNKPPFILVQLINLLGVLVALLGGHYLKPLKYVGNGISLVAFGYILVLYFKYRKAAKEARRDYEKAKVELLKVEAEYIAMLRKRGRSEHPN